MALDGLTAHGVVLACFFLIALCKECAHINLRDLDREHLRHLLGSTGGETVYGFCIHIVIYSSIGVGQWVAH